MKSALDIRRKSPSGRGDGGGGSVGVGDAGGDADVAAALEVGLGTSATDGLGVASAGASRACIRLPPTIAPRAMTSTPSHSGTPRRGPRGGPSGGGPAAPDGSATGSAGGGAGVGTRMVGLSSAMSATVYGQLPGAHFGRPSRRQQALPARTDTRVDRQQRGDNEG